MTKAYTDYLRCVSEHANLSPKKLSQEGRGLASRTADAKCRIGIYGSAKAITAFAEFERLGAAMNTEESRLKFTEMVEIMRKDSSHRNNLAISNDLKTLLLGTRHERV